MTTKAKATALAALGMLSLGLAIEPALADDIQNTCTDWQIQQGLCEAGLRSMILSIINWFLFFLGLVATAFLIYGGFLYTTSAGNDENIGKAKNIIIYAAIGIIIIILAAVLVNAFVNMIAGGVDNPGGGGA